MRSFKSNENIHKKEGGSYYVVSANKASSNDLISDFIFDFTAAGVVPCGGRKTSPRTSTIVQFIFYFGPLRSAIIF